MHAKTVCRKIAKRLKQPTEIIKQSEFLQTIPILVESLNRDHEIIFPLSNKSNCMQRANFNLFTIECPIDIGKRIVFVMRSK